MIYDVSVPLSNRVPVWPSGPPIRLESTPHLSRDKSYTIHETFIQISSHMGTHIDAPYHFVENGRRLHEIPLERLVGKATVFEIPGVPAIGVRELRSLKWDGVERVLFKTENSKHWQDGSFYEHFVYLEPEGAQFLVDHGVQLVGIDYLSIEKFRAEKHLTHFTLLKKDVVIIEGLDLSRVAPGEYSMVALPLNLFDTDGGPTRVILMNSI
jgi:arylformamidase